jgi:hypothetical protein
LIKRIVKYLPEWFPGTGFKRTARNWGQNLIDMTERPYAFVKSQMAQGKYETSFISELLESDTAELDAEEEFVIKWSGMSLYAAGADTVGNEDPRDII